MKKLVIALASVAALNAAPVWAEISYDQILMDPDNVELNRAYALERIQARDIKPALSAIERVIHANPLDLGARLIRAQILIYLGDFALARGELEVLSKLKIPDTQAAMVDELLTQAQQADNPLAVAGYLGFGISNDSNIGGHTDSGLIADKNGATAGNTFTDSEGRTSRTSDTFNTVRAGINLVYDLGTQTRDDIYLKLRAAKSNGQDSDIKDYLSKGLTIGTNLNYDDYKTSFFASYDVSQKPTVNNSGTLTNLDDVETTAIGGSVSRQLGKLNLQSSYSYTIANFSDRGGLSDASDSNSHKLNVVAISPISNSMAAFGNASYTHRRADKPNVVLAKAKQDRNSINLGGGIIYAPMAGHKLTTSLSLTQHDYQVRNTQQDQFIRDDLESSLALSYKVEGKSIDRSLDGWAFDANALRSQTRSNMDTYDVTTNIFGLNATYTFGL